MLAQKLGGHHLYELGCGGQGVTDHLELFRRGERNSIMALDVICEVFAETPLVGVCDLEVYAQPFDHLECVHEGEADARQRMSSEDETFTLPVDRDGHRRSALEVVHGEHGAREVCARSFEHVRDVLRHVFSTVDELSQLVSQTRVDVSARLEAAQEPMSTIFREDESGRERSENRILVGALRKRFALGRDEDEGSRQSHTRDPRLTIVRQCRETPGPGSVEVAALTVLTHEYLAFRGVEGSF